MDEESETPAVQPDPLKPLSEEERRANLRALLGEQEADKYFDVIPASERVTTPSGETLAEPPSLVNWKFVGTVGIIFIVVMAIVYAVTTGANMSVDTIAPTNPAVTPIPLETPTR